MKQFIKALVAIVILGVIGFGVYLVLPEHPHNFVKSFVQPITDSRAKELIGQVQNMPYKELNNVTYKQILEANNGMSCWVYETRDTEPGVEYVIYRGSGASMNLKEYADYNGKLATSTQVKFEFKVQGDRVDIFPYIDGERMYLDDAKHAEDNKKIKASILRQLYTGMSEE